MAISMAQLSPGAGFLEERTDGDVRKPPLQPSRAKEIARPGQSVQINHVEAAIRADDLVLDAGPDEQNVARNSSPAPMTETDPRLPAITQGAGLQWGARCPTSAENMAAGT
jgi:hypothetical protein